MGLTSYFFRTMKQSGKYAAVAVGVAMATESDKKILPLVFGALFILFMQVL